MNNRKLLIGTRGSRLALWQAQTASELLAAQCPNWDIELRLIKTEADIQFQTPLDRLAGKNAFVKAIEEALLNGEIDLAVHSLKDMPARLPEGLVLGAYLTRGGSPRDALLSRGGKTLEQLPAGALLATSSPRRRAQLRLLRPDLNFIDLRGNVDSRLKKLESGVYQALVLAEAGLARLGFADKISQIFPPEMLVPAAGQGVLGLECREGEENLLSALALIDEPEQRFLSEVERSFLAFLGVGCHSPAGVWAQKRGEEIGAEIFLAQEEGKKHLKTSRVLPRGTFPRELGEKLGREIQSDWEKLIGS